MKKRNAILSLIAVIGLTALLIFTSVVGWGENHTGAAENIKLGLDLAGGASITYQTVDENPSMEDMKDTIYKMQKRLESDSAEFGTEFSVYQEGSDRICVEIPGIKDANAALESIGKPGSLEFQLADGTVVMDGTSIADARAGTQSGDYGETEYVVQLTLTSEGSSTFSKVTGENIGKNISIVYDGNVISSPTVKTQITQGVAEITGMESQEEAEDLASSLRIGSLSLELNEVSSNIVGASLGQKAIKTSLMAGAIGLGIVIVFMLIAYLISGLAASIALIAYVALMIGCLNFFEITLTLPGIAGIVLSIGMAVDANVIIFARIKEEIALGKTVRTSIKSGFQKALSAIIDGNITTLIAAAVLGFLGTGSVKGFAQTLALGIVLSMFTALVVSKLVLNSLFALGLQSEKLYRAARTLKPIDFLGKKTVFFIISIVAIISGFIGMAVNASQGKGILNYSLEFQGGTSTTVDLGKDLSIDDLETTLKPIVAEVTGDNNIQMQKVSESTQVVVKTRTLNLTERESLYSSLAETFGVDETTITSESISAIVSGEMKRDAIIAVLVATILMLIYIRVRFKDLRFAASAVLALLHDVFVVLAFYALFRVSVGNTFIACMLTIVGYSINATIVIFDRIRENMSVATKNMDLKELVNRSITQTLTRSIYTSFTTIIMVAVLYIMGVASIREFALPLMVGLICGAYSSVCITGALWYIMKTGKGKKA